MLFAIDIGYRSLLFGMNKGNNSLANVLKSTNDKNKTFPPADKAEFFHARNDNE